MDDRHIEELLRKSCRPDTPDGMKDRVLRAARQELRHERKPLVGLRWKPLLASLALCIVLVTNIVDGITRSHMTAMLYGQPSNSSEMNLCRIVHQRDIDMLLAMTPSDSLYIPSKGDDSL